MRLIPRSPFVPKSFNQYVLFRRERVEAIARREMKKLAQRNHPTVYPLSQIAPVKVGPAMGGQRFNDGLSAVLAQPTMWSHEYEPSAAKPQAPWPTLEEMKEEGDEMATSEYGRFLGLPRVPANETVVWKQRHFLPQYPFDEVWRQPDARTYEDARRRSSPEEMTEMEALLGKELVDALDCKVCDDY